MGWEIDPSGLDRALELADRAQALDPSLGVPYLVRAGVHLNRRQPQEAEAAARTALRVAPGDGGGHVFLGVALMQQGGFQEGLASLRTAIRLNPRSSEFAPMKAIMATALYRLGQTEEAVLLWERARSGNPDLVSFRIPLLDHYEATGQHEKAAVVAREILAANPEMTAEVAARSGFVSRADEEVPATVANLRRAGLP